MAGILRDDKVTQIESQQLPDDEDDEDQQNELLAIESILDPEQLVYQMKPRPSGQIYIDVELPKDFKIFDSSTVPPPPPSYTPPPNQASLSPLDFVKALDEASAARMATYLAPKPIRATVEHLPPLTLHFTLPMSYPSWDMPLYTLQSNWLDRESLSVLCQRLDQLWNENKNTSILYSWVSFLQGESIKELGLTTEYDVAERALPPPHSKKRKKKSIRREDFIKALDHIDGKGNSKQEDSSNGDSEPKPGPSTKPSQSEIDLTIATLRKTGLGYATGPREPVVEKKPSKTLYIMEQIARDVKEMEILDNEALTKFSSISGASVPPPSNGLDQRAVFDNSLGHHAKEPGYRMKYLIEYNEAKDLKNFNRLAHTCGVCFTDKMGKDFLRLRKCGHNFCMDCCSECYKTHITEGNIQEVKCLAHKCSEVPSPLQVKELVGPELFERYDTLMLQRALSLMNDIIFCPRHSCNLPVIRDQDENEKLACCLSCEFKFCIVCKMAYHGVEPCRFKAEEKLRVFEKYHKASRHEQIAMEKKYGKKQLDLLVQATLSEKYIERESKPCPNCKVPIEKFEGCNKVTCTKCGSYWCWTCSKHLDKANPYYHFQDPQSPCFNLLFGENDDDEDDDWIVGAADMEEDDFDEVDDMEDWMRQGALIRGRDLAMMRHIIFDNIPNE